MIFKVFCADHTYTTLKMRVDTPASRIIRLAADKLGLRCDQPDDLKLCEVKSIGGASIFAFIFKEKQKSSLFSFRTNAFQRK